jgi:hypothetical protein
MPRRRRPFRGCVNSEVGGGDEGALARDQGPLDGVCSSRMLPGQGCRCSTSRASRLSVTSALPILGPSVRMKWSSRAPHPTRVRAAQAGARCTVKTASRYKGSLPNRPAAILRHRVPVGRGDKADTGLERRRSPRAAGTPAPAARGGASPAPRPRARRPRRARSKRPGGHGGPRSSGSWIWSRQIRSSSRRKVGRQSPRHAKQRLELVRRRLDSKNETCRGRVLKATPSERGVRQRATERLFHVPRTHAPPPAFAAGKDHTSLGRAETVSSGAIPCVNV